MKAKILDGEALAQSILMTMRPRVQGITKKRGRPPLLAIVSVGEDPASKLYAQRESKICTEIGIQVRAYPLPADSQETEIISTIKKLGADNGVDGILIESPLPKHLHLPRFMDCIPQEKDVEGLGTTNYGRLFSAKTWEELASRKIVIPPTSHSILQLLIHSKIRVGGAHAVVIGRSNIAGKPISHLLSCLNATVTLCHSKTRNIKEHLKHADIVVTAAGKPRWIKGGDLKRGMAIIDAGINYQGHKLCGDVDFESAAKVASHITPVPGGVGPVTTALLISNIVLCAEKNTNKKRTAHSPLISRENPIKVYAP